MQGLVGRQRPFTRLAVIDNGPGVIPAYAYSGRFQNQGRRLPGEYTARPVPPVPARRTYSPAASKRSPWVTGLKIRKNGAASAPQPATHCQPRVLLARSASTRVSQNQRAPSCQGQILDQKRCRDHANAIVHPAGLPQLPHARIDNGITGLAPAPGLHPSPVFPPGETEEFIVHGFGRCIGKMMQQMMGEIDKAAVHRPPPTPTATTGRGHDPRP